VWRICGTGGFLIRTARANEWRISLYAESGDNEDDGTADTDKTRLSCLDLSCSCQQCEHNCRQDKTVLTSSRETQFPVSEVSIANMFETKLLQIGH